MTKERGDSEIWAMLEDMGAVLRNGHFLLPSTYHTDTYAHVRVLLADPAQASRVGQKIAERLQTPLPDLVVGYSVGGIRLAKAVAHALDARFVGGEMREGHFCLAKQHQVKPGEKALIIDDVLTTEQPMKTAIEWIKNTARAAIVGAAVVLDRSTERPEFGTQLMSLTQADWDLWTGDSCPKCSEPLTDFTNPDGDPIPVLETIYERVGVDLVVDLYNDAERLWHLLKSPDAVVARMAPACEFPGLMSERVAVLGSFDNPDLMRRVARYVAGAGRHALTSRLIYERNLETIRPFRPYPQEAMNPCLRRMLLSCRYAIIVYTHEPGGHYIETVWCSESRKPTLGLVCLRSYTRDEQRSCPYLISRDSGNWLLCDSFQATRKKTNVAGAWICARTPRCPFVKLGISKMVLDCYVTSEFMFLAGTHDPQRFDQIIRTFLENDGSMEASTIP